MKIFLVTCMCFIYAALNVTGSSLIKYELNFLQKQGQSLTGIDDYIYFIFRLRIILALSVIVLSMFAMFKALSMYNFSFVVPIATGINFMLTIMIGILFFSDKLSLGQYLGLLLILSGILTLSLSAKSA